jgi:hypothetical protein
MARRAIKFAGCYRFVGEYASAYSTVPSIKPINIAGLGGRYDLPPKYKKEAGTNYDGANQNRYGYSVVHL